MARDGARAGRSRLARAERTPCFDPRLLDRSASIDEELCFLSEMKLKLIIEVAIILPPKQRAPNGGPPAAQRHGILLRRVENARDGFREPLPARPLGFQLTASGLCEPVILRPLVVLRQPPLGLYPTLLLETVKRGIERAVVR